MASAWFSGTTAGLLSVLASILAVDYFFVPPFHSFAVNATEGTYFAAFIGCALVASWVSSARKKSEVALKEARSQLEVRVARRTAELQKSNTELREREHQLRLLTEVIPQQIWRGTSDGSIDYCNQRLLDYVGRATEEMTGERFMETIHDEDRESYRRAFHYALATGKSFEGEWRVRGADGTYRWFFTRGVPLRDAEGEALRWYGTNTDIEERKKAEQSLMRTQAELARLSRVLTMGELAASIAHEVNQPLTAIVTYGHACLEWLSAGLPNLEQARAAAEKIIKDGTRAGAVLGRIRAMFHKEALAKGWVDMNEVIQELIVFLSDDASGRHISIHTELTPDLPKVTGDRVQLQQVMLNLIMNGMDAMRGITGRPKELRITSRRENSAGILICVEDSGVGLSAEAAEKIFTPFFTTKPLGIGMGLPISRSIVESHEGRLWAAPRLSGGAIFQFTIPTGI
jgi:PAS domain S-box-containing protein